MNEDELRTQDPTEYATIWGLSQPLLRDQLYQTYHSGDVAADARRFYASEEFEETLRWLSALGKGPGQSYRLVDVGCGNGIASYAFARAGYVVTGSDISEGALAGLAGARAIVGLDGVQFSVMNIAMDAMPATESVDVIYMRQALHHSADPVSTVRNLSQLLTPGGIFCAVREHVILNDRQLRTFLARHPFQHITRDEHAFTLVTYRTAFRAAHLDLKMELYPFDSAINFHPGVWRDLVAHLSRRIHIDLKRHTQLRHLVLRALAFKHQLQRDQMYSFFGQKPRAGKG
jgi:SAM-dependent methyltransferase